MKRCACRASRTLPYRRPRSELRAQRSDQYRRSGSVLWLQEHGRDQRALRKARQRARTAHRGENEAAMSAADALVELVRAALRDPAVRADILELVSSAAPVNDTATEPLLDAVEAAKILGMTPPAVRAAAYRETLPCVRVGRLLRFRRSELLAAARR